MARSGSAMRRRTFRSNRGGCSRLRSRYARLSLTRAVQREALTGDPQMNGAESLARTLVAGGVNVCFTNPGTSEMHFVAALAKVDGIRCVLGLFEGGGTGAPGR